LSFLIKSGFTFSLTDSVKGTSPLQWACHIRDIDAIKILIEEAKVIVKPLEQGEIAKILRKPASLEGCYSYSQLIENYLFEHKVVVALPKEINIDIKQVISK